MTFLRRPPVIGALLALVVAAMFFFFAWRPASAEQQRLEAETSELSGRQQSLRNEIAHLRDVAAREAEIRAALGQLEQLVPAGAAQPTLVQHFQSAADAAGVQIRSLAFQSPTPVADAPATGDPDTVLSSIDVTMTVDGGYFQVVDFFRRVEAELPRAVLVDNLSLAEGEAQFPTLSTTWSGRVFGLTPAEVVSEATESTSGADTTATEQP